MSCVSLACWCFHRWCCAADINIHNSLFSILSVDAGKKQLRLSMARPRFFVGGAGCGKQWLMSERDLYDPGTDPMQNLRPGDTLSCHRRDATISLWAHLTVESAEADKQPNASFLPSTFTLTTRGALPTTATKGVSCWIDRLSARGAVLRNNSFHHGLPGAGVRWKSSGGRIERNTWTDSVQTHIEVAPYSSVEGPVRISLFCFVLTKSTLLATLLATYADEPSDLQLLISNVTIAENRWVNSSWWRVSTEEDWQPPCATAKAGTSGIRCAGLKTDDGVGAVAARLLVALLLPGVARAPMAFTWQPTSGGARYPNVTTCPGGCTLLQPMPWLSLPATEANGSAFVAAARQIVSELRPLPAGRRVIMMRTHTANFIDTDPADFIGGSALRHACTGADAHFSNFSGLW